MPRLACRAKMNEVWRIKTSQTYYIEKRCLLLKDQISFLRMKVMSKLRTKKVSHLPLQRNAEDIFHQRIISPNYW